MRKLASIQKIEYIESIEGADRIQKARILGWDLVIRKDEFGPGDLCVYFEIDSLLPKREWSEFLEASKYRIKTIKLRGTLSQGLALPLSILPEENEHYKLGEDVTETLEVTKYEPPQPKSMDAKGNFPSFISKTDEIRIQSCPNVLKEIFDAQIGMHATVKLDGQSGTYANWEGEFFACSRRMQLKEGCLNQFWDMAEKYRFAEVLPYGVAVQGELCGPGIQGNHLELKEVDFFVFNVYDIKEGRYYDISEVRDLCFKHKLTTVPSTSINLDSKTLYTVEDLLELVKGNYKGTEQPREGLVFRPLVEMYSPTLQGRLSFKVVNNDFLLKTER